MNCVRKLAFFGVLALVLLIWRIHDELMRGGEDAGIEEQTRTSENNTPSIANSR